VNQRNEMVRIVFGYLFAFYVIGICFWFLFEAFLNPKTVALPDTVSGMIVGGILIVIQGAATFVFGQAIMQAAARSSATATQAGVNAALSQPLNGQQPTVTADSGPPPSVTITPAGSFSGTTNTTVTNTTVAEPPADG